MEDKTIITCFALLVLAGIEIYAMRMGFNGQMLLVTLIIIAGMVGVPLGHALEEKRRPRP